MSKLKNKSRFGFKFIGMAAGVLIIIIAALLMLNYITFPKFTEQAKVSDLWMQEYLNGERYLNDELTHFKPVKFTRLGVSYYSHKLTRNVSWSYAYVFENENHDFYYVAVQWSRLWFPWNTIKPNIVSATDNPNSDGLWQKRAVLIDELNQLGLIKQN